MGKVTGISWTDHTANFWWGCIKVDRGCEHCYAETLSKRVGYNIWGPEATTTRRLIKSTWNDIVKWDKQAGADGVRRKVFIQSMSDFLEHNDQLDETRKRAKGVIEGLRNLDVLLLSKRPQMANAYLSDWISGWPSHVWFGTSVAEQKDCERVITVMSSPAPVKWISVEPQLGPVDLFNIIESGSTHVNALMGRMSDKPIKSAHDGVSVTFDGKRRTPISWVIVGGESGAGCRPFDIAWARDLLQQCRESGTAFFMKQLGGHPDKRHDPEGWPEDIRVREFPR